ncbi:hypothetical protein FRAAL0318 [Frankia alni ACN14a]|uniref:Uncharacterized protein n=1 Tax=Frankia alni (strain DSM 45986 / CECT 9034 / ACN14a) TaxID=326424 RepID=Q0RTV4_FRAAA|nr:hypothetical protein FRAAL0318 [Frankia alni ACN14a]
MSEIHAHITDDCADPTDHGPIASPPDAPPPSTVTPPPAEPRPQPSPRPRDIRPPLAARPGS